MSDKVADELEIRSLVAAYADGVNRRDADAWSATWADDGTWTLMGMEVTGRDKLVPFWKGAMGTFDWVLQLIHSGTVDITGDRATTRFYLSEAGQTTKGDRTYMIGVYHDVLVRTPGGWRFQERHFSPLYQGPPDLSGNAIPFPSDD